MPVKSNFDIDDIESRVAAELRRYITTLEGNQNIAVELYPENSSGLNVFASRFPEGVLIVSVNRGVFETIQASGSKNDFAARHTPEVAVTIMRRGRTGATKGYNYWLKIVIDALSGFGWDCNRIQLFPENYGLTEFEDDVSVGVCRFRAVGRFQIKRED